MLTARTADSTHSWQHAQLTADSTHSWQQMIFHRSLISWLRNSLISWFPMRQTASDDFPRSKKIQLIFYVIDSFCSWCSWFPTRQKDSADFLRFRQLLIQLIYRVSDSFCFSLFSTLQTASDSVVFTCADSFRFVDSADFKTWHTASESADFLRDRKLLIQLISNVTDSFRIHLINTWHSGSQLLIELISHVVDIFWFSWYWTRSRQLLFELISHLTDSFLFSWFPWWQTASVWANFPCDRQLLTQLISHVAESFDSTDLQRDRQLLMQLISHVAGSFWKSSKSAAFSLGISRFEDPNTFDRLAYPN